MTDTDVIRIHERLDEIVRINAEGTTAQTLATHQVALQVTRLEGTLNSMCEERKIAEANRALTCPYEERIQEIEAAIKQMVAVMKWAGYVVTAGVVLPGLWAGAQWMWRLLQTH